MEPIRPVTALPPAPAFDPPARATDSGGRSGSERPLDPAVSLDIGSDAGKAPKADRETRGFERDRDSKAVVYRVTDTVSGDVIVQIPNEIIIKARVYGRDQNPPATGARVERRA